MRKIVFLLITSVVLTACSTMKEKKEMKEAAYQYSFAMANYRFDDAIPYATEKTKATTIKFANNMVANLDTNYIIADTPAEIEILTVEKTSDSTGYAIYHKTTPIKDFKDTLYLVKQNGKWLAHAPLKKKIKKKQESQFEIADSVLIEGQYHPLFRKKKVEKAR